MGNQKFPINLETHAEGTVTCSIISPLIHHYILIVPCVQCMSDCIVMIVTHPTTVLHSSLPSLLTTASYITIDNKPKMKLHRHAMVNQSYYYVHAVIGYHNRFIILVLEVSSLVPSINKKTLMHTPAVASRGQTAIFTRHTYSKPRALT